jgi:hypothetical protein
MNDRASLPGERSTGRSKKPSDWWFVRDATHESVAWPLTFTKESYGGHMWVDGTLIDTVWQVVE